MSSDEGSPSDDSPESSVSENEDAIASDSADSRLEIESLGGTNDDDNEDQNDDGNGAQGINSESPDDISRLGSNAGEKNGGIKEASNGDSEDVNAVKKVEIKGARQTSGKKPVHMTALECRRKGIPFRKPAEPPKRALKPKYSSLSTSKRLLGSSFGAGFASKNRPNTKLAAARKKKNGTEFLHITYGSFGYKGHSRVAGFQPKSKDYEEMSTLLAQRGGRPGPGTYADGMKHYYSIARSAKGGGVRYEDGEWGKKIARKPKFDDPDWKQRHLLAGSLHRLKSKQRPSSAPRTRKKIEVQEEGVDGRNDDDSISPQNDTALEQAKTPQKIATKKRPHSAKVRRRSLERAHLDDNISQLFRSKKSTSFGPGFGSPLRTPMKKWRRPNHINYLQSSSSMPNLGKAKTKNTSENVLKPRPVRRGLSQTKPKAKLDIIGGKEMSPQQLIRSLPKFYDPSRDPAMKPRKISGSKIAPLSSLNVRQKKLLKLAQQRARQPRSTLPKARQAGQKKNTEMKGSTNVEIPGSTTGAKSNPDNIPTVKKMGGKVAEEKSSADMESPPNKNDNHVLNDETDNESDDEYTAGL